MKKLLKVLGILIAIPVLAFAAFCVYDLTVPKICVVYLDNGMSETVKVKMDGQAPVAVNAHEVARREVSQGAHKFEVLDGRDKLIDTAEFTYKEQVAGDRTKFVFNIGKASRYAEYAVSYGSEKIDEPKKSLPQEHFFESSVQTMELCDAFPKSVAIRKGSGGARRTILAHDPIHKSYPCCRKLWESIQGR